MLKRMYSLIGFGLGWSRIPAPSSFCRARRKVTEAMWEQVRQAVLAVVQPTLDSLLPTIRGYRVVAIDGSWIDVPNSKALREALGVHQIGPKKLKLKRPQGLLVVMTEAITRRPLARVLLPGTGSERAAAQQLMPHLLPTDIVLMDRGYHSRELLDIILKVGCRFIMRMPSGQSAWRESRPLQRQRIEDAHMMVTTDSGEHRLRHVRISDGPGRPRRYTKRETMFLMTNLPAEFEPSRVGSIYRYRWGIETMFREFKHLVQDEPFSGRTVAGVLQEVDARLFHLMLASLLDVIAASEVYGQAPYACWYDRFVTNRNSLLAIADALMIYPQDPTVIDRALIAVVQAARESQKKRVGRYAPRNPKMFMS